MAVHQIEGGGFQCIVWCPGCESSHGLFVTDDDGRAYGSVTWGWDRNMDLPTFSPSLLVHSHKTFADDGVTVVDTPECHSFILAGSWQFLTDSTHALAGQTVDMPPLPEWCAA